MIGSALALELPETWVSSTDGTRLVLHSPKREEVIVSAYRIVGNGLGKEQKQHSESIFQNALRSALNAASHPDLNVVKALDEDRAACVFPCWTILAETRTKDAFFGQAVIRHPETCILLTYEAPFVSGAEETFRELLLRNVRSNC
ncbi:hypothetical protein [Pedosphaera parvula]|nr:hypothetical protein [Pedosphaera parvula]